VLQVRSLGNGPALNELPARRSAHHAGRPAPFPYLSPLTGCATAVYPARVEKACSSPNPRDIRRWTREFLRRPSRSLLPASIRLGSPHWPNDQGFRALVFPSLPDSFVGAGMGRVQKCRSPKRLVFRISPPPHWPHDLRGLRACPRRRPGATAIPVQSQRSVHRQHRATAARRPTSRSSDEDGNGCPVGRFRLSESRVPRATGEGGGGGGGMSNWPQNPTKRRAWSTARRVFFFFSQRPTHRLEMDEQGLYPNRWDRQEGHDPVSGFKVVPTATVSWMVHYLAQHLPNCENFVFTITNELQLRAPWPTFYIKMRFTKHDSRPYPSISDLGLFH